MTKLFPFILLLLLSSCSLFPLKSKADVVAEVNKKQLLASDIVSLIPTGLSREDSLSMLRQYINTWALAYLLESKAQKELSRDLKDVSRALEEYRRSLLVFQYEKSYVETRIDTSVTQEEIRKTYQDNKDLFSLSEPIAKVRFVKVSLSSPNLEVVRSLYRTQSTEETLQLEQMVHHSADKYDTYNDQWIGASLLSGDLPLSPEEVVRSMNREYIECADSLYAYFVSLFEKVPAGALGPLEYEEPSIRNVILGRRKIALLKNLEKEVLNEGWRTNQLKVYLDENE